jgi:PAS domain S-box-containing protein
MAQTDTPKTETKDGNPFLLVGIGASAGGVQALQDLFATIPANSNMAYVVILHLSQQHESKLDTILQAKTPMPVQQVQEPVHVEPNHVYVIPPGKFLEMVDGIIRLREPERIEGKRISIDHFFRTLADAYGRRAVCILLSGTGTDGTLGMKHIKERNGFAIVQDPAEAVFDTMPRSAVNTGLVDLILPIAKMAEKLLFVRDTTEQFKLTNGDDQTIIEQIKGTEALRDIITLLRLRTGNDFSNYKQPTILRRIARHLQIHELDNIPDYLNLLRQQPEEVDFLLHNLLINVTNFFRDPGAFQALNEIVIPKLFENKTENDNIRVWVPGCASGEEAYSLAMLLLEYAEQVKSLAKIQIFASDVDSDAIAEARQGRYMKSITLDVSEERLNRFFIKEADGYRVRKQIRELILFAPHNILRDPPFSRLDLISCRNVFIYLNRPTQEKVLQLYNFALRRGGHLFLGSSESAEGVPQLFTPVDKKNRIYLTQSAESRLPMPLGMPEPGSWQIKPSMELPNVNREKVFSFGEFHHRFVEQYAPPSVLVNEDFDVVHLSENAGRYLRFAGGEPTNNLLKVLHPDLRLDLRAALFTAQQERRTVEVPDVRMEMEGTERFVTLTIHSLSVAEQDPLHNFLLILFEEHTFALNADSSNLPKSASRTRAEPSVAEEVVRRLEEELQRTKDRLRSTIEQYETSLEELKASNEELQAINEELRSASEELETSKEEMQSVNEELTTVNHELKNTLEEISHTNADLQNLMYSTDIGTIFLDRNLRIKRFTPEAQKLFNVIPSDVGRPLAHLTHSIEYDTLSADANQVLRTLQTIERTVRSTADRWYLTRLLPYRTVDDRIDGVVVTFIDITERKSAEDTLQESKARWGLALEAAEMGTFLYYPQEDRGEPDARMLALFGLHKGDTLNLSEALHKMIHPDDREYYAEAVAKSLDPNGDGKLYAEIRVVHPDKSLHWVAVTAQNVFEGEPPRPVRMYGAASDITERKWAEEISLGDLKNTQLLQEISARLITESDIQTLYQEIISAAILLTRADAGTVQILDDENQELVLLATQGFDRSMTDYFHRVDASSRTSCGIAMAKNERTFVDFDVPEREDPDGSLRRHVEAGYYSAQSTPLVNRLGKAIGMVSTHWREHRRPTERELRFLDLLARQAADLIELRQSETNLRESEERLRLFITATSDIVYKMSADWSEMVYLEGKDFLASTENPSGTWLEQYIPTKDQPEVMLAIQTAIRAKSAFELEHQVIQQDGTVGWTFSRAIPFLNEGGEIIEWFGAASDITERKRHEVNLAFLAEVSQDLANLTNIEETMDVLGAKIGAHFNLARCIFVEIFESEDKAVIIRDWSRPGLSGFAGDIPISQFVSEEFRQKSRAGEIIVVNDVHQSPLVDGRQIEDVFAVTSFVSVPLLRDSVWKFLLAIYDATPREWRADEIELIQEITNRIWTRLERARAEKALAASEEKYRTLFESMDEGFCTIQVLFDDDDKPYNYRFLDINPAFIQQTDLTDAIGKTMLDFAPEMESHWFETYGRVVTTGEPVRFENRAEQLHRWYDVYAFRVGQPEEHKVGVLFNDITERKKAEIQLRRNHETFFNLVQNTPFGIYVVDSDFRLIQISAGSQKVFSNIDPLIGRDFAEILRVIWEEPFATEAIKHFRHTLATGETYRAANTTEQRSNVDAVESYDWKIERVILPDGQFGVVCYFYDLTELKQAQEDLRRSEERLTLILESVEDYAILTTDLQGNITRWNKGAENVFGYTSAEIIGQPTEIIFTPEDRAEGIPAKEMQRTLDTGRALDERWHLRKDGSRFFASGVMNLLHDGYVHGFVKVARDLTLQKKAEEALLDADRKKNEFLAVLAHELRNPLTPIQAGLKIIRQSDNRAEEQRAQQIIERQVRRMTLLIDDLLEISRITKGKVRLNPTHMVLSAAIQDAVETTEPLMTAAGHTFTLQIPDEPIQLYADETRIAQIITNLLSNAIKYTPPGGKIRLSAIVENDQAVVRVQDNGIGIPPDKLEVIFGMFNQIEQTGKQLQTGLGIGLSLVKTLVELHGGTITAHSRGEDQGSEFVLRLPLSSEPVPDTAKPTDVFQAAPTISTEIKRLLVVEDDPDIGEVMQALLEMEGYEIKVAQTGESGVALATEFQAQAALVDIGLPDMDGYEVARRLRTQHPAILLIAHSGWGSDEDRKKSKEAGFDHHLVKPAEVEEITGLLKGLKV